MEEVKTLYKEIKDLASKFQEISNSELGKVNEDDLLRVNELLNQEEKQDKSLNENLELQNFYLAIKLNFFRVNK
ncbi:hypothetical protein [Vagococcus fluvialis]|uniref:hypothetical protein n=1 Tax=Vagococcus fluvialis TaxID=2738 RepID=UPI001D0A93AF|nr:hypothetical protein [Vagococcus fluvialis]UDM74954.1 hypothetical protein K5K99_05100 [Vagococcus fluvialis]UDM75020.1 hypothetical protein K5K99_05445 [Vagococcus fluvialis]